MRPQCGKITPSICQAPDLARKINNPLVYIDLVWRTCLLDPGSGVRISTEDVVVVFDGRTMRQANSERKQTLLKARLSVVVLLETSGKREGALHIIERNQMPIAGRLSVSATGSNGQQPGDAKMILEIGPGSAIPVGLRKSCRAFEIGEAGDLHYAGHHDVPRPREVSSPGVVKLRYRFACPDISTTLRTKEMRGLRGLLGSTTIF